MSGKVPIDEGLMVSVVRYALGRATYVVAWTVNETIRVWPDLSENTRHVIRRDVEDAIKGSRVGMDMDLVDWRRLLIATKEASNV